MYVRPITKVVVVGGYAIYMISVVLWLVFDFGPGLGVITPYFFLDILCI